MIPRKYIPHLETLEAREMLSGSDFLGNGKEIQSSYEIQELLGPNAQEQEMLELINRMRMDPQGELSRLIRRFSPLEAWDSRVTQALNAFSYPTAADLQREWTLLSPVAPLAWNNSIAIAAATHNYLMQAADTQQHQIVERGELPLPDRLIQAGFEPYFKNDPGQSGGLIAYVSENIYAYGRDAIIGFSPASFTHAAFALDWGIPDHAHRDNIMDPNFTDVGISMIYDTNPNTRVGPWLTTVDFGAAQAATQGLGAYLVGVVYNDSNRDGYYQAGEGITQGLITVNRIDVPDSEPIQVSLYQAGGYQVYLESGFYSITITGPQFSQPVTKLAMINGSNVKVDFTVQNVSNLAPILDLNGPDQPGLNWETTFDEGSGTVRLLDNVATLTDIDSLQLTDARIVLEKRPDGLNEYLTVNTSGTLIKSFYNAETGILQLTGDARVADYLKVLKTLEYGNTLEKMDLSDRIVKITVSDGVNRSEEAIVRIGILQGYFETLTISSEPMEEGDTGTSEYVFWLDLSDVPRCEVRIEYVFGDGTGINGTHFFGQPGTLIFEPNQTRGSITVEVPGNYLPDSDRDFTLQILNVEGTICPEKIVQGIILDDDTPKELGEIKQTQLGVLDLSAGRRVLYSFTPSQTGLYVWESFAGFNQTGYMELLLFEETHAGIPLVQSSANVRARLEWELEKGKNYILLLKADLLVESLNFAPKVVVQEQQNQILEIVLDQALNSEVVFRLFDQMIEYNGISVPWGSGIYNVYFQNTTPETTLRVIPDSNAGSTVYQIDLNSSTLNIGDVQVSIEDFATIIHEFLDPNHRVEVQGTPGNDSFEFWDGVATLESSLGRKHVILNAKHFSVEGGGGVNRGLIVDTPFQDSAFFERETVRFFGGGDTGYQIELHHFSFVDVSSIYGGYDILTIVNEADNNVELGEYLAIQNRTNVNDELISCFYARGFHNVSVYNQVPETNTVLLEGGVGTNLCLITPDRIVGTNTLQNYYHTVYGGGTFSWKNTRNSVSSLILTYDSQGCEQDAFWEEQDDLFSIQFPASYSGNAQGYLEVDRQYLLTFYFEGQLQPLFSQESGFDQVLAGLFEPVVEVNRATEQQYIRTRDILFAQQENWFADDWDWVPIQRSSLSVAELALYYSDWNR